MLTSSIRRAIAISALALPLRSLSQSNQYDVVAERFALQFMSEYSLTLRNGTINSLALREVYSRYISNAQIEVGQLERSRKALGDIIKYAPTRGRGSDRQQIQDAFHIVTLRCFTSTGTWNVGLALVGQNDSWRVVQIQLEPD